jgi:hypothetical protein
MAEQSVQACYADITNQLCPLAHNLGGNFCFRCDGQISGAGCNYRNNGFRRFDFFLLQDNCLRCFLKSDIPEFFCFDQRLVNLLFGSCGQDIIAFFSEVREDFNYLFGGFAGAVNDFREAAANLAVMVYAGKAQILKRQVAKFFNRLLDVDFAGFDLR